MECSTKREKRPSVRISHVCLFVRTRRERERTERKERAKRSPFFCSHVPDLSRCSHVPYLRPAITHNPTSTTKSFYQAHFCLAFGGGGSCETSAGWGGAGGKKKSISTWRIAFPHPAAHAAQTTTQRLLKCPATALVASKQGSGRGVASCRHGERASCQKWQ